MIGQRRRWVLAAAAGLAAVIGLATAPGAAGNPSTPINLHGPVSTTEATFTPNIVIGPWPQDQTTQVWAYAPMSGVMYACGDFAQVTSADGVFQYDRNNVMAFDPLTGTVLPFAPDVNGPVYTCAATPDGLGLYIGGNFTTVNGQPANHIAMIDVLTGQLDPVFNASVDGVTWELQVVGHRLLVGGGFTHVDGHAQTAFATVNAVSGAFDPEMDLSISGQVPPLNSPTRIFRFALDPRGKTGVALGDFTTVNGVSHQQVFRFSLGRNGARLLDWDNPLFHQACGPGFSAWVRDVQFAPNGRFFVLVSTGGVPPGLCDTASRWESSSRGSDVTPTWVSPTCNDTLHSVAVTNKIAYVQGHQKCVLGPRGHEVPRFGIAALSTSTGFALRWRSDQTRRTGGKFLMITDPLHDLGFPAGLWAGCDCGAEGGIIFRPYDGGSSSAPR